ncbi:MAG: chromosome segregation protein ScpA [Nitrososphaera sp.]|nr:chromosome segregation protein ScpA [Nitrososphaera sp.]
MSEEPDTRKSIAQPPLNLLFNPSLLARKDVWNIDLVRLLEMFLQLINATGNKDLRICGIAAVSSSLIYRLKVESIFLLEKIAMQRQAVQDQQLPIPQLNSLDLPFRIETNYPVTVEELLRTLENMILELAHPRPKKKQIELEPVQSFNFDQYLVKFEQVIQGYEEMILDILSADGSAMFKTLVSKMEAVEVARCFIAMLYLAMKGKVDLEQAEDSDDTKITLKHSMK